VVEVSADLVLAPGAGAAGEERHRRAVRRRAALEHLEVGHRWEGARALPDVHPHPHRRGEGEGERRVHGEALPARPAGGEGEVGLRDGAVGEGALEPLRPLRRRAAGEEPRGLAVEAVGRIDLAVGEAEPGGGGEGVRRVARGGVGREPRRLVHDEEGAVVVDDAEGEVGLGLGLQLAEEGEGEPGHDAGGGLEPAPLALEPVGDEVLHALAGEPRDLLLQVAVQPPAGVVRLDGEADPDVLRHGRQHST
jgi:hypothetical protein